MSQHDMDLANAAGAAFRTDLNAALVALVGQNSGATEPATMFAYQWWADTTTGLLKIRNAANTAWVTVGTLADTNFGLAALAGATFTGAINEAYATVASHATTAPIWAANGNVVNYTGTATATAFPNAPQAGATRELICAGACSFTFGAKITSPHFASGYTYTAQENERVTVIALSTTTFRIQTYPRSGVYTPTLYNTTNVASSTAFGCQWNQVGNTVTVSGQVAIDPTSASITTLLGVSLPIPSAFTTSAYRQAGGTGCEGTNNRVAAISADPANARLSYEFLCGTDVANKNHFFSATYLVI